MRSNPPWSAVRAIFVSVGPISFAPPGHVKNGIWRPIFIAARTFGTAESSTSRRSSRNRTADTLYRALARWASAVGVLADLYAIREVLADLLHLGCGVVDDVWL